MKKIARSLRPDRSLSAIILSLLLLGCNPSPTPRPDFSAISSPQAPVAAPATRLPATPTNTPEPPTPTPVPITEPAEESDTSVFAMDPASPTPTPEPPTPTPEEVEPTPTEAVVEEAPAAPPTSPPPPPQPQTPPDEPRAGGSWDLEDGFAVWINPYGDDCSGSQVANGWQGFTSRGQYGSSCFYPNEYAPNVFSGRWSQEVTFDFVDSHAGLYRIIETQPGHTYEVTARLKHVHTLPAMQFAFGYDLTGDTTWDAETVQWAPWGEFAEGQWITHVEQFTATGEQTTIFIKGFHPTAAQGGATYIDAVEVVDLGTQ